jgi:multiple sugar transport system permease protein
VPGWLPILAVFALPILGALWLSFRNETLGSVVPPKFIGFVNYAGALADPRFWEAIRTTIWLTLLGLLVQMPIGIGLAVIPERNLRGTQIFRTILIIPMLLTPVALGLMWRFMFDTDLGIINWALGGLGIDGPNWLGARWPTIWAQVIVDSWQSIPLTMLIVLAGLAGLPKGPQEAAAIDGADALQGFVHVTLPALGPVILVTLMIRIIDSLMMFDIIFILTTPGGPGTATRTLVMPICNAGFGFFQTSRAAALGILMVMMVLPVYRLWRRAAEGA